MGWLLWLLGAAVVPVALAWLFGRHEDDGRHLVIGLDEGLDPRSNVIRATYADLDDEDLDDDDSDYRRLTRRLERQERTLGRELHGYVVELVSLYQQRSGRGFGPRGHAIGEEINATHGFVGMQVVCESVGAALNSVAARELDCLWHGIGRWER